MLLHEASNSLRVVRFAKYPKAHKPWWNQKLVRSLAASTYSLPYVCGPVDKKTGRKNLDLYLLFVHGFHDLGSVTTSLIKLFQTQSKYLLIILILEIYIPKLKLDHHFNSIIRFGGSNHFGLSLELSSLTLTS